MHRRRDPFILCFVHSVAWIVLASAPSSQTLPQSNAEGTGHIASLAATESSELSNLGTGAPLRSARPPAPAPSDLGAALRKLKRWAESPAESDGETLGEGAKLLRDINALWSGRHAKDPRLLHGVLDFLGRCIRIARDPEALISGPRTGDLGEVSELELRETARGMVRDRLDDCRDSLRLGILLGSVDGAPHPVDRRAAACEVLAEDPSDQTTLALLTCTRPRPPEVLVERRLMDAAIASLVGREDAGVHLRLLTLLERSDRGHEDFYNGAIEGHFGRFRFDSDSERVLSALSLQAAKDLGSADWRRASRGAALSRALPDNIAFPLLIGALEAWVTRDQVGEGPCRRVLAEMATQLEGRSGKSLGPHPPRWRAFWDSILRGKELAEGTTSAPTPHKGGRFFGLRPESDRLVFLLDASGSMNAPFADDPSRRRLDEAADEMRKLLDSLGPRTRFSVVLFNDRVRTWNSELQKATGANIEAACAWVKRSKAARGTHLFAGVQEVTRMGTGGKGNPVGSMEADTVIVLCDGETREGPTWVDPLLRQVQDRLRLAFHAVQLGPGGDGTLEALAGLTGGQFHRYKD